MKPCSEQYQDVCKERFDKIDTSLAAITKKLFHSNGERALVEIIRDNTEGRKHLENRVAAVEKSRTLPPPKGTISEKLKAKVLGAELEISGNNIMRIIITLGVVYMILAQNGIVPVLER